MFLYQGKIKNMREEIKKKKRCHIGKKNPMYGKKQSEITKEKIRQKMKGNKNFLGKKHSEKTKKKFSETRKGKNNPNWKGGRFKSSNGYIWFQFPSHPFSSKVAPKGYILEHRFIMEKKIGRYLKKGEIVHHINGIRDDNRPENLVLTISGKHIAKHNSERVWKESSKKKHKLKASKLKRNNKGQFIGY